jgi:hypothetical protein
MHTEIIEALLARFSLLYLDHDEYYFRWHDAVALYDVPIPEKSSKSLVCSQGILHVCGNGLFFEPQDQLLPMIRIPMKFLKRFTPWIPDVTEWNRLEKIGVKIKQTVTEQQKSSKHKRMQWLKHLVAKPDRDTRGSSTTPGWELLHLDADYVIQLCCNGQDHPALKIEGFGPIRIAVKPDPSDHDGDGGGGGAERSTTELLSLLAAVHARPADAPPPQVDDDDLDAAGAAGGPHLRAAVVAHEARALARPPPPPPLGPADPPLCSGRAVRVEPLLEVPGRMAVTPRALCFRGFHQRPGEPELVLDLAALLRAARRRHVFQARRRRRMRRHIRIVPSRPPTTYS